MDDKTDIRRRLDACKYLYLVDYGPGEHDLDLVVEVIEAQTASEPSEVSTGSELVDSILGPLYPIASNSDSAKFKLTFHNYIVFAVHNESYMNVGKDEDFSKKLRTYEKSVFLNYIGESTFAGPEYPGPFKHFAVVCLNHVIEVACSGEPDIEIFEN